MFSMPKYINRIIGIRLIRKEVLTVCMMIEGEFL